MHRRLCILLVSLLACGGRYRGAEAPTASQGIAAAGMPYTILDARTGHQIDASAFWARARSADVVCVGEEHPNPHHHWVQLQVVRLLATGRGSRSWALGMEMFQRPFQGVLDDFAAKRIDETALLSRSGWEDRWGYDYALYGPIIVEAVSHGGHLLALNSPKELVKKISHHGLESLTSEERATMPELKLDDAAHRAWFQSVMEDMGGAAAHSAKAEGGDSDLHNADTEPDEKSDAKSDADNTMPSEERIYTVQVLWDEAMADGAAQWLHATSGAQVVILAGTGHCHDSAIIGRVKRRGISNAISIRTVIADDGDGVASALAKPINDFVFVLEPKPSARTENR